jgi:hypothetical protein
MGRPPAESNDQNELGALADRLVEAALKDDAAALREVVSALDDEDESIVDDDTQAKPAVTATLTLERYADESAESVLAEAAFNPTTRAAMTELDLLGGRFLGSPLDINALVASLRKQVRKVTNKDLDRGEAMLAAQAHTLDAIYNKLLRKALIQEHAQHVEMFFKLALRAQSQCRATWEAISAIQNPPIAGYVGQANIANQQQVNNNPPPTRTDKKINPPNKLLEQTTHEADKWLDRGSPTAAERSGPAVEAVGAIDRAQDSSG